jgi:hypothetical protein
MQRPRTPSRISESLHQRLNSYALAASAAGVGVLALASPVEGKIVYTRAHKSITPNHTIPLDLNHDGIIDFAIHFSLSTGNAVLRLGASNSSNEVIASYTGSFGTFGAAALHAGSSISSSSNFRTERAGLMVGLEGTRGGEGGYYSFGHWRNVRNRYLGLKFLVKGKTHYGWARLNVNSHAYGKGHLIITGTLTGYAYETIPNKPIIAGKTHGLDVITVHDATLGHLARGASAIPAWRQQQ